MRTQRKIEKQNRMPNGSSKSTARVTEPRADEVVLASSKTLVNSKIEITNPSTNSADEKNSKDRLKDSLQVYRGSIVELGRVLAEVAIEKAEGNLLNAKLGLWGGIAVIEAKLKENRQI